MRKRSQPKPISTPKASKASPLPTKEPEDTSSDETPKAAAPKRRRRPVAKPAKEETQTAVELEPETDGALRDELANKAKEPKPQIDEGAAAELRMGGGLDDIVDNLFDYDVKADYATIMKALTLDMKASKSDYGSLVDALDDAESNVHKALQILANAKVSHKSYNAEADTIEASLREAAIEILEREVTEGTRQKRYTKDDIQSVMVANYHDEYRDLEIGRAKVSATTDYIEGLARTIQERARDLRQMVAASARH